MVGGGINGAAALYELVRRGVSRVLLVERGRVAGGPTGLSSAIVRQHYADPQYARMALDSLELFERFTELTGGDAGFRATGYLSIVAPADVAALQERIAAHRRIGIDARFVDTADITALEPLIDPAGVGGAVFEPRSGHADPAGTSRGLVAAAVSGGATVWSDTAVDRVLTRAGRVIGVETERGVASAERVLLAAGPWTAALARPLEVDLPTRPERHPVAIFEAAGLRRVVADMPNGVYVRPEGRDLVLAGGLASAAIGTDADPDDYAPKPTLQETEFFAARVVARFPALAAARSRGGWAGIYDVSPDRVHIIDELPTARGCVVLCGTSGHGFKLGPAVGALAVDLLLGEAPRYDAGPFRLDRFAHGERPADR